MESSPERDPQTLFFGCSVGSPPQYALDHTMKRKLQEVSWVENRIWKFTQSLVESTPQHSYYAPSLKLNIGGEGTGDTKGEVKELEMPVVSQRRDSYNAFHREHLWVFLMKSWWKTTFSLILSREPAPVADTSTDRIIHLFVSKIWRVDNWGQEASRTITCDAKDILSIYCGYTSSLL